MRAAFADISLAELDLGWKPAWRLEDGVESLLAWMDQQPDEAIP